MTKQNIDKLLSKWCKKQAKKLLKTQAKYVSSSGKVIPSLSRLNTLTDKSLTNKKAQRKHLTQLLSKHIAQQEFALSNKSTLKKQLKLAKAKFIAANDATFSSTIITRLSPLPSEHSFALRPFKKSPCGGCPALKGKLCKCALKVMQRRHAS
ncbi:hypothetical protein ACRN9F_00195 [Shewanella oncorhynchi]|uniref:hypothetical protein n=1 Tax=Shewanella oncorhynchi TaxID=2726434 RepID=UPI003D7B97CC